MAFRTCDLRFWEAQLGRLLPVQVQPGARVWGEPG